MMSRLVTGNNSNDPRHLTPNQTLKKDTALVYSCGNIKYEIEETLKKFQPPATYCQPHHGQLYRLANAIYYPEKILEQDREPLKLITTVHNKAKSNQYHGALFLNGKTSQIIIVNKGTDSLGSLWADIRAVVNGNLDNSHILSALTFALEVRDVVEKLGGVLQINVTGHSLGGFLSTVQAFGMEWLQLVENEIQALAINTYRVHVVGFESPGSKDFLTKLHGNFFKEERYVNNRILECLDLTNYTTDPNGVNTYGLHLGTMYSFSPAFYNPDGCYPINVRNINAHSVANFETLFDEDENIQENANLKQILDHPVTTVMRGGELQKLQHCRIVNITREEILKWRRFTAFTSQVKQFLEAFELLRDVNFVKNNVPEEIRVLLQGYVVTIGNGGFSGVKLITDNATTDKFVAEVDMFMRKNQAFISEQLNGMKNYAEEWVTNLGIRTEAHFKEMVTDFQITENTYGKYLEVDKLKEKTNISVIDLFIGVNVVAKVLKHKKKSYRIFLVGDIAGAEFDYQRHIKTDVVVLTCADDVEINNADRIGDGISSNGVKVIVISENRDGIALEWDDLLKKSQDKIMDMEVNLQGNAMLVSDLHIPVVMELLKNLLKKEYTVFHLQPIGHLPEYFVEGRISESRNSMGCVTKSPMQLKFSACVNELSGKILIITGTSGLGKSAFLTNLVTKQPLDGNIRLFLQLRKVIPELKLLKTQLETMTLDDAVDFLANSIKLDAIEGTILNQSLISVEGPRLNLLVDGFDEVCPDYEETLVKLFEILNNSTMKRMWISTRHHFEEKLVQTLQCPSYKVLPLLGESATKLLSNRLNDLVDGWVGTPQQISLCQSWLGISEQWTNDGSMTTPLLILLLADHVAPIATKFVSGEDITSLYPLKINIVQLFDSVFGEKLKITKDKMNIPVEGSVGTSEIIEASVREKHEFLALKELDVLGDEALNRAFPRISSKLDPQLISRQGIFYYDGSSYYSVHRAFAEYLVGSYLSKDLKVGDTDEIAEAVKIAIVREVAQPRYLQLLKKVINKELKDMGSIPEKKLKWYGESFILEMDINWSEGCTFTHRINQDGNANILEFVLKSVKIGLPEGADTLKNLLGSRCGFQQSPMLDADSAEIVKIMFKYGDCFTLDEKKGILFGLGEANFSYFSSFSAIVGRDDAFTALVGQTEEVLTNGEISDLFLSKNKWGSTLVWSSIWATNTLILDCILNEVKRRELLIPLESCIFPEGEISLLNTAARQGYLEAWEKLNNFCRTELSLPADIQEKELYLRMACTGNTSGIDLTTEEKEQVLLGLDNDGLRIFDNKARKGAISEFQSLLKTARSDCPNILETILENSFSPGSLFQYAIPYVINDACKDTGITESQYFMKFLRETDHPFPVMHSDSHADLWAWMTGKLTEEEMNEALFERMDTSGNTAFSMAIKFAGPGNTFLYDRIMEHFNTCPPSNRVGILKMKNNQSPFHIAANARVDDFPLVRSLVNVALANGIDIMAAFAEEDAVGENVWEILVKWGSFVGIMDFMVKEKGIVLDRGYVRNVFHRRGTKEGRNVVGILKVKVDQGWQKVTEEVKFYQGMIECRDI